MINAFYPQANTIALAVGTTSHSPVQALGAPIASMQYEVFNAGPNTAFLLMAAPILNANGTLSAPSMTVTIPVDGTPGNGVPIPSGALLIWTGPPNAYFSAICSAGQSATLYITPGDGV